jgi:ABC-type sugar transport system permease subunit
MATAERDGWKAFNRPWLRPWWFCSFFILFSNRQHVSLSFIRPLTTLLGGLARAVAIRQYLDACSLVGITSRMLADPIFLDASHQHGILVVVSVPLTILVSLLLAVALPQRQIPQ